MTDEHRPRLAAIRETEQVYQPAEDSHLLAKTATGYVEPTDTVLDVGTGSGYVGDYIATETGATVVGIDLNPEACTQARNRGLSVLRGDIVSPINENAVDVVCFNPPYLPDSGEGVWDDWMEHAVTGGSDGRAVIERFLDDVDRVLRPDGEIYLLISTLTGLDEVKAAATRAGFETSIVAEESHPFEKLLVLRILFSD